ncbi:MAG: hydrogenase nickel incorporation protein HypB [Alphaproteobacteria bacterium]
MCGTCGCSDATRVIELEQDILHDNDRLARANRAVFAERALTVLNVLSSPGSGKTSLLVRTIADMGTEIDFAVIEGDQQTDRDAQRIRATGAPAAQINTGKGCHLDAHMVGHGLERLTGDPAWRDGAVLMIENVGNLVCPAGFDLGEAARVVILSLTEGEDKPLKYPDMFRTADLVILAKSDLLPYLDVDIAACVDNIRRIRPSADILTLSAKSGEGLDAWYGWLRAHHAPELMSELMSETVPETVSVPGAPGAHAALS